MTIRRGTVEAQYTVLRRTDDDAAITALLRAVAPGGTLLVVHHELDPAHATEHGFDPADYVMPGDVAAHLDNRWEVEVYETRPRPEPVPPDAPHIRDVDPARPLAHRSQRRLTGAQPTRPETETRAGMLKQPGADPVGGRHRPRA